jgi:deazaflavin-dependent oxidoreductase (nitroreductase family)
VAADDYCYLTTTGCRSGRPHRIEIWYVAEGDTLYLLAGAGRGSDWVRNLEADPAVSVELGAETQAGRARILEGGDEEERRARTLVFDKYAPRNAGDLNGWREAALPVAIDLSPGTDAVQP